MAGLEGAHADEGYANTGGPKDGPVLTMMSKRLRALRKKFNRILQIEENKAQGKPVNKEQEDVLKTKIAIAALIDEYEKLRQPLLVAVREEVSEREKELMAASLQRQDEDESVGDETERDPKAAAAAESEQVNVTADGQAEHAAEDAAGDVHDNGCADEKDEERVEIEIPNATENHADESTTPIGLTDAQIGDLLKLLYFAQLFDVRPQGEAPSFVWTKVHERSSCLSYDFVTDDATTPLVEGDLDALSVFGSLLTTRSPNVTVSHKEALEKCIEHAKAYMAGSDGPVGELGISYSRLRERLNRILSSEYFTMTPELQTVSQQTAAAAATAAGQYVTKAPVLEPQVIGGIIAEEDDSSVGYYHQDVAVSAQYYQPRAEYLPAVPMVLANGIPLAASPLVALTNTAPYVPETMGTSADTPQFGSHDEVGQATSVQENSSEQEHAQPVNVQPGLQGQQHHNQQGHPQGGPRGGGYQNMRGRQGGYGGQGGRGGRGGFPSGRGGRTGRGPGGYVNGGRGGHFFEQGGYYPRNHYGGGGRGGRGGRGGGGNMMYNGHANGPAPSGPPPPAVATGSS